MFASDSLSHPSGLGYIAKSIISRFADNGHKVSFLTLSGPNTVSNNLSADDPEFQRKFGGMPIYNCQTSGNNHYEAVEEAIKKAKPNVVFTIHDPWVIDSLSYNSYRDSYMLVNYVTIETPSYPERVLQPNPLQLTARKNIADVLRRADIVIPVTPMGQAALRELKIECTDPVHGGIDTKTIYSKDIKKREAFGNAVEETDFIFMTMGLNTARKRIDKVVEAFHVFFNKVGRQNRFKLYLHTDVSSATGGTDLREMVESLKLSDNVLIATNLKASVGLSRQEMYKRYKASDCYIGLPSAEGLGYGFVEAMAHGLPLVYINYGGHKCYCEPAGLPVKVKTFIHSRNAYMRWAIADVEDAAKAMARIVSDKKLRDKLGSEGREIVLREFSWDTLFPKIYEHTSDGFLRYLPSSLNGIMMRRLV
jgi:glycosyltransferase involved in cell wall biosynthesis